jgi:hypothetical protein
MGAIEHDNVRTIQRVWLQIGNGASRRLRTKDSLFARRFTGCKNVNEIKYTNSK